MCDREFVDTLHNVCNLSHTKIRFVKHIFELISQNVPCPEKWQAPEEDPFEQGVHAPVGGQCR